MNIKITAKLALQLADEALKAYDANRSARLRTAALKKMRRWNGIRVFFRLRPWCEADAEARVLADRDMNWWVNWDWWRRRKANEVKETAEFLVKSELGSSSAMLELSHDEFENLLYLRTHKETALQRVPA